MNPTENKLLTVFLKVFGEQDLEWNLKLTADDIDMWDSLTHLELIHSVEQTFKISIPFLELVELKNTGDLLACVQSLIAKKNK